MKKPSDDELPILLSMLDLAWRNVQHNEKLRNSMFSLYLVVIGASLAIDRLGSSDDQSDTLLVLGSLLATLVGFVFSWTYLRFRSMIGRDMDVIMTIESRLQLVDHIEPVTAVHARYRVSSTRTLSKANVTYAFVLATLIASSGVLSASVGNVTEETVWIVTTWIVAFTLQSSLLGAMAHFMRPYPVTLSEANKDRDA